MAQLFRQQRIISLVPKGQRLYDTVVMMQTVTAEIGCEDRRRQRLEVCDVQWLEVGSQQRFEICHRSVGESCGLCLTAQGRQERVSMCRCPLVPAFQACLLFLL